MSDDVFLSVVVPTYNRAAILDRKLSWLHSELRDLDVSWEVRVHDNGSSDETPEVLERWQGIFGRERFEYFRNVRNVGLTRNLSAAIEGAKGTWTWTVGDDDLIDDGTPELIVSILRANPDLALLYLNYGGVDAEGRVTTPHYFDPAVTGRFEDGRVPFEYHTRVDLGVTIFLTATIFRTTLVRDALAMWEGDRHNWALFAFLTGYVAAKGPILITEDNHLDCLVGESHWQKDPVEWAKALYFEIPLVCLRLGDLGYDPAFCREIGFRGFSEIRWTSVRSHLRGLRAHPGCLEVLLRLKLRH
jgi:glycosyltransferase involved in cell wall biosynthesis